MRDLYIWQICGCSTAECRSSSFFLPRAHTTSITNIGISWHLCFPTYAARALQEALVKIFPSAGKVPRALGGDAASSASASLVRPGSCKMLKAWKPKLTYRPHPSFIISNFGEVSHSLSLSDIKTYRLDKTWLTKVTSQFLYSCIWDHFRDVSCVHFHGQLGDAEG